MSEIREACDRLQAKKVYLAPKIALEGTEKEQYKTALRHMISLVHDLDAIIYEQDEKIAELLRHIRA